jgi:NAD(P)-dependent dehydrogenase (short-subunit alcohol dehydrogenase family)
MNFEGKSVIITGASGGVGSETARLFAEKGANITVNYFSSPDKAENTALLNMCLIILYIADKENAEVLRYLQIKSV